MESKVVVLTHSTEGTMELGELFGQCACDGLFIALSGDLGAGKTHFIQGLARGMHIPGVISSPTFNIMNYYEGSLPLKHFDFYRLDTEEDLYNIGWEEYGTGGVVVCEWADMYPNLIPEDAICIKISLLGETERKIEISWGEKAPESVIKEIKKYALGH